MGVFRAYGLSWQNRATFIPVFLAVRLLSLAIIAPLIAGAVQLAVSFSGRAALTDQDIASFILSPLGFPIFVVLMGIVLVGSVFGTAVMTLCLANDEEIGLRALRQALLGITRRLPSLLRFAVELVLRALIIVLPFAVIGAAIAFWLLGDYDINYYLTAQPREFILAVAIGGALAFVATTLLLSRLLNWAIALHMVLFGASDARGSFNASAKAMHGNRAALLRDLVIWFAVRACLAAFVSVVIGSVLHLVPLVSGENLKLRLGLTSGLALVLAVVGLVVSAISVGALAKILLARYEDESPTPSREMRDQSDSASSLFLITGACAIVGIGAVSALKIAPSLQTDTDVTIIAHRGSSGANPENTLAAIRAAVTDGSDWVEIDVQETADGSVVVMHDSDFMKLSGEDLKIWDATMGDLEELDIGSWFDESFAEERVPTLAQALEEVRDHPSRLLIELKYYGHDVELESRTAEVIEAAGMTDQVALMSLKYPAVQKMKELRPDWDVGVLAATAIGDLAALEADFVAVNANMANARLAKRIQDAGKRLLVWTINDPIDMSAMMSIGVDGIITDEPALAREVASLRASMTGAERMLLMVMEHLGLGDRQASDSP